MFSVASWLAILRRRPRAGAVLGAVAALYLVSYSASLASALGHRWDQRLDLVVPYGYFDLRVTVPAISGSAAIGSTHDFDLSVANTGTGTAFQVKLLLQLSPGMRLLGPPYFERGSGCTGRQTVDCELDFLEPGMRTPIRFAVVLTDGGEQTLAATVSSPYGADAHPDDNRASVTFIVP